MQIFGMDITLKEILGVVITLGVAIWEVYRRSKAKKSSKVDMADTNEVDQSGSKVKGDQIGRDKITVTNGNYTGKSVNLDKT